MQKSQEDFSDEHVDFQNKHGNGGSIISKPSPEQVSLDIDGRTGGSFCQPAIPGMCLLCSSLGEGLRKQ